MAGGWSQFPPLVPGVPAHLLVTAEIPLHVLPGSFDNLLQFGRPGGNVQVGYRIISLDQLVTEIPR